MDVIELRGIRALGRHGVLPEEQERAQPFEIDLEIEADLSEAAATDELAHTIDYGTVANRVSELVVRQHFQLLETLAAAVAELVLVDSRASAVTVTVRKLRPPVAVDLGSVAVRLSRSRS